MEQLFNQIVENALDFLGKSVEEFEGNPKYSVIHFHAAIELFLKARLMSEHWSLVVTSNKEPDRERFVSGDFQSVSLDEAATKLKKAVQSGLTDQELRTFKEVTKHRNKMVHFFHEAHSAEQGEKRLQAIAKQQLGAWYLLHRLLRVRWRNVFDDWAAQIEIVDQKLRKHHAFLQVVFDHLGEEIRTREEAGAIFRPCPSCEFESQEHRQELYEIYNAECLVCGLNESRLTVECSDCDSQVNFASEGFSECDSCGRKLEPEDVADLLLDDETVYIAAKEGDDSWDLGNCGDCDGYHTVARTENNQYICASCFRCFESMQRCEWCNEPSTNDMEHSYLLGCNQCDGLTGWHGDD